MWPIIAAMMLLIAASAAWVSTNPAAGIDAASKYQASPLYVFDPRTRQTR